MFLITSLLQPNPRSLPSLIRLPFTWCHLNLPNAMESPSHPRQPGSVLDLLASLYESATMWLTRRHDFPCMRIMTLSGFCGAPSRPWLVTINSGVRCSQGLVDQLKLLFPCHEVSCGFQFHYDRAVMEDFLNLNHYEKNNHATQGPPRPWSANAGRDVGLESQWSSARLGVSLETTAQVLRVAKTSRWVSVGNITLVLGQRPLGESPSFWLGPWSNSAQVNFNTFNHFIINNVQC